MFSEYYIKTQWRNRKQHDVIFWEKNSMFACCGSTNQYNSFIGFNRFIKASAYKLIHQYLGDIQYNAIHVRRGGKAFIVLNTFRLTF